MAVDPVLEPYTRLRDRDLAAEGLLVAEGPYLVERLLASSCVPRSVLCLPDLQARFLSLAAGRCPVRVLDRAGMRDLVGFPFHRGALACATRPPHAELATTLRDPGRALVVVCPDLNDDANVGLVLRSALAFGARLALLGPACVDPWGRRALRLSMGASLVLPMARYREVPEAAAALRDSGYTILGTANHPEARVLGDQAPPARAAVLIGSEAVGLDAAWLAACDAVLRIPVSGRVDSLGASVAAGIALYVLSRSPDAH